MKHLLCHTWDCSVPYDTLMSHMRPLCAWLQFFSYETNMSQMRFLCPTWDCSSPHDLLFPLWDMRLPCRLWDCSIWDCCPTWDCFKCILLSTKVLALHCLYFLGVEVWDGTGRSGTILGLKFWGIVSKKLSKIAYWVLYILCISLPFSFLGLICASWDWSLGRDWDRQDWDNLRTEVLRYCKQKVV